LIWRAILPCLNIEVIRQDYALLEHHRHRCSPKSYASSHTLSFKTPLLEYHALPCRPASAPEHSDVGLLKSFSSA
jgi:hypothetical protein